MLARVDRLHRDFFRPAGSAGQPVWEPPVDVLETAREVLVFVALAVALGKLRADGKLTEGVIREPVAATSVGYLNDDLALDLVGARPRPHGPHRDLRLLHRGRELHRDAVERDAVLGDAVLCLADCGRLFDPEFAGVTASDAELEPLLAMLGVAVEKHEHGGENYNVVHNSAVYVLDANAEWIAGSTGPHDPKVVASDYLRIRQRHSGARRPPDA